MIGTVINNYRIVGVLDHSGGTGVVYRAEHVTKGQKAVIKQLLPQFNQNPQVVVGFLNEARAAAAIDDPGIVRVFDQGTLADGTAYLTMELLAGESLRSRLQRECPLPPGVAVGFARQAARAVGAAHRHGIVHRDLKPENLFVCRDPELPDALRIKVLDFGIAKLTDAAGGIQTQTGMPLGTPAYMAPEQWRSADRVDGRTDIYALGCVLYEMLVGKTPFPGPELPDFMDQHRFREPPPPSSVHPSLAGFDSMIQRALAKSPEDRFASMEELIAALPVRAGFTPAPSWATGSGGPIPVTLPAPTPASLHDLVPAPQAMPRPGRRGSRAARRTAAAGVAGLAIAAIVVASRGAAQPSLAGAPVVADARPSSHAAIAQAAAAGPSVRPADAAVLIPGVARCVAIDDAAATREVRPPLGRPTVKRSEAMIVDFSLDRVAAKPEIRGAGGIATQDRSLDELGGCGASSSDPLANPGRAITHAATGLAIQIVGGDAGGHCSYRLADAANPDRYASLGPDLVPAFNSLTGVVRDGNVVYAALQFNGYARETRGKGNFVVMLDLCEHRVVWRSRDMTSNAAMLVRDDALITGYGFTAESDFLYVLNRWTGKQVQRVTLPKSPTDLRVQDGMLVVRIYDGYVTLPLR